jgi:hypothetical protein
MSFRIVLKPVTDLVVGDRLVTREGQRQFITDIVTVGDSVRIIVPTGEVWATVASHVPVAEWFDKVQRPTRVSEEKP